ncbi:MAG: class I SAM-dependent methyltransferase [Actinomycetota bacterium]
MVIKHLDYDEPVLRYHAILADLVADLAGPDEAVIDIGCGPGQILSQIAARRPDLRLVGVDGDAECLRRAADRCPTATFVEGNIQRLDEVELPLDGFPLIVSSHALEHVPDPVGALQSWQRRLGPGGRLVIAVPNSLQPLLLARALARRPKANEGHYYIWDRATFENFCQLAGFRIVDRAVDYVPLAPVRVRERLPVIARAERTLLGPLPQFSNSHIVVLEPTDAVVPAGG